MTQEMARILAMSVVKKHEIKGGERVAQRMTRNNTTSTTRTVPYLTIRKAYLASSVVLVN